MSTTTIILLAAVGVGAYYTFGRTYSEIKVKVAEPQYENPATVPIAPILIVPAPAAPIPITPVSIAPAPAPPVQVSGLVHRPRPLFDLSTVRPGSFVDRYIKRNGFPPGH